VSAFTCNGFVEEHRYEYEALDNPGWMRLGDLWTWVESGVCCCCESCSDGVLMPDAALGFDDDVPCRVSIVPM
jgi:hypothetical protein